MIQIDLDSYFSPPLVAIYTYIFLYDYAKYPYKFNFNFQHLKPTLTNSLSSKTNFH